MQSAQETVLEEGDHVGLSGFLEGLEGDTLEPHVMGTDLDRSVLDLDHHQLSFQSHLVTDFSNDPGEGEPGNQQVCGFLIFPEVRRG